jgi:hypothetical protein
MHNPGKKPPAPSLRTRSIRPTMRLSAEQRRALGLLAGPGRIGVTGPLLAAHGFSVAIPAGLVNRTLATLTHEKVRAGGKLVDVAKVRITDVGREVLAAEG